MARYVPTDNLKELRRIFDTEVNAAKFNPDIRDHTPINIIIIIENDEGHLHCIVPHKVISERMFERVIKDNRKVFDEILKRVNQIS